MISYKTQPAFHNKKNQVNWIKKMIKPSKVMFCLLLLAGSVWGVNWLKSKIKTQYIKNKYQTPTNNL